MPILLALCALALWCGSAWSQGVAGIGRSCHFECPHGGDACDDAEPLRQVCQDAEIFASRAAFDVYVRDLMPRLMGRTYRDAGNSLAPMDFICGGHARDTPLGRWPCTRGVHRPDCFTDFQTLVLWLDDGGAPDAEPSARTMDRRQVLMALRDGQPYKDWKVARVEGSVYSSVDPECKAGVKR